MDEGLTYYELKTDEVVVSDTKNKRSVWSVTNKPYREAHFATYPPDLIEPCILAGSEVGDIVLDPFMGSGTTAAVAKALGRDYIGCELHEDYGNLIQKRVEDYVPVNEVAQEPCILAGSEKGDIILDPFMGSGTTAAVAKALGRDYIGCELHEDYGNLIQKRVQEYKPVQEVAQEPSINILDII